MSSSAFIVNSIINYPFALDLPALTSLEFGGNNFANTENITISGIGTIRFKQDLPLLSSLVLHDNVFHWATSVSLLSIN